MNSYVESMTIAQTAEKVGVKVGAIRFYERRGLLPEPPRSKAGYRQYSNEHVRVLQFIKRGRQWGFNLNEISDLLGMRDDPVNRCIRC